MIASSKTKFCKARRHRSGRTNAMKTSPTRLGCETPTSSKTSCARHPNATRSTPSTNASVGHRINCGTRFTCHSASASPRKTQTVKPPKSKSASHLLTASVPAAPPRSSTLPELDSKWQRGSHAPSRLCATTPRKWM